MRTQGVLTLSEDDPCNHFDANYFERCSLNEYNRPRLDLMTKGFEKAKEFYGVRGGTIRNATVGGKLEVSPPVSFDSLF